MAAKQEAPQLSEGMTNLITANTNFAVDVYRQLRSEQDGGNMFFSPTSISAAFAMCLYGAKGDTAKEIKQVLKYADLNDAEVHAAFGEYLTNTNRTDAPYILKMANRLYTRKEYKFLVEYLEGTLKHYQAEASEADFVGNAEGARAEINEWVESQTANKIKDLLAPGSIDELTTMVLVNAVYFKGAWKDKFDERGTHTRAFLADGKDMVDTEYMFQSKYFSYALNKDLDCRVMEIPYTSGDLGFYILLPNEADGLKNMEDKLTGKILTNIKSRMKFTMVDAYIPKFRMEFSTLLHEKLVAMGMKDLFSGGLADLSGMDGGRQLYVSAAVHKAFIEVNEEGSEAAASTAISVTLTALPDTPEFVAQHPFLYLIRDNKTGAILFMGRYCRPPSN